MQRYVEAFIWNRHRWLNLGSKDLLCRTLSCTFCVLDFCDPVLWGYSEHVISTLNILNPHSGWWVCLPHERVKKQSITKLCLSFPINRPGLCFSSVLLLLLLNVCRIETIWLKTHSRECEQCWMSLLPSCGYLGPLFMLQTYFFLNQNMTYLFLYLYPQPSVLCVPFLLFIYT